MNTLRQLMMGMVLSIATILAQAGPVTLKNFELNWNGLNPNSGGIGTVHYAQDGSYNFDTSFQVNMKPWQQSIDDTAISINDWLTPLIGSDTSFVGVDLEAIQEESRNLFLTSIGPGYGDGGTSIYFEQTYVSWEVTHQIPSQVPEPSSLALLSLGLIGVGATTLRRRKIERIV